MKKLLLYDLIFNFFSVNCWSQDVDLRAKVFYKTSKDLQRPPSDKFTFLVLLYDLFWNSFNFKQFLNDQKGFPLISGIFAKTYMSIVMLHCIYLYQPNFTGNCFLVCNKVLFTRRDIIHAWQFIAVCTLTFTGSISVL